MDSYSDFSDETRAWQLSTDMKHRKKYGQYMTPASLINKLLDMVGVFEGASVLDPGVGTGEFLAAVHSRFPDAYLEGWDVDDKVLTYARKVVPSAKLLFRDALLSEASESFDFVIGNPPYFQLVLDSQQRSTFSDVISGRPNIFALFFKIGVEQLKPGGKLAFVVPPSMNSGAYFGALRKYLTSQGKINDIFLIRKNDLFEKALTSVQIIVFEKTHGLSNFCFRVPATNQVFFSDEATEIEKRVAASKTINDYGFNATTGTVVWNQHKEKLTNIPDTTTTFLAYARNLGDGTLKTIPDETKGQYLTGLEYKVGPAILVNRIIGNLEGGTIRAALIPPGMRFLAENHLNVIVHSNKDEPITSYHSLLAKIKTPEVAEWARKISGNTQISASEWNTIIPID